MCLSGAGVDVLPAGGGGEVEGDLAGLLEPERAGRPEDSPAVVVERLGGQEATLTVSSVSDPESRSCQLAAVSAILVLFSGEKSSKK